MVICGVVCELNPFHYGHEYLFKKARQLTGADYIIAVMSGDFVQRGLPAICDKYARSRMALMGGADLVIELPAIYATASADYFAMGAVSILDNLQCVDYICFGSESGDIDSLRSYADRCINNIELSDSGMDKTISIIRSKEYFRDGLSYTKSLNLENNGSLLSNDILGACYLKSLITLESQIEAVTIKRRGSVYLDSSKESESASGIRKRMEEGSDYNDTIPEYVSDILDDAYYDSFNMSLNDFSLQLFTRINTVIRQEARDENSLRTFMDVSDNIAGHIRKGISSYTNYESFINSIHSKEYTKSRIMRALIHILLDIRKEDYEPNLANCTSPYVRILGFRRKSLALLSQIKESSIVPLISKASDAGRLLDDDAMKIFDMDIYAAGIYEEAAAYKFKRIPRHDYTREIVLI